MVFDLKQLKSYKGFIFDLDGVLWTGDEPVTGSIEFINELLSTEYKVRFVSNTSSRSLKETMKKIKSFGYQISEDKVIVASRECARLVARDAGRGSYVYLIGSEGLSHELKEAGLKVIKREEENLSECEYVVCGFDDSFNYSKMFNALSAFMNGAGFAAVNLDATAPIADGKKKPAGGAMAASLEVLAERPPDIMPGKPEPDLLERAAFSAGMSPDEWVMIGDTPEADIVSAKRADMLSGLVFSGNVGRDDLDAISEELRPDFILDTISDLSAYLPA